MPPNRKARRAAARRAPGGDGARLALWILLGIIILAFAAARLRPRGRAPRQAPASAPSASAPAAADRTARPAPARPASPAAPAPTPTRPPEPGFRCAIIIDDVGYSKAALQAFLDLDLPLNFAVLPQLALSKWAAQTAAGAGHTVMLHLPMEPEDPSQIRFMGPGGVLTEMPDDEIEARVIEDLESLGAPAGLNNHMGSKATADARVMKAVMRVLKDRGLFFVDSLTTGRSAAAETAREAGVPVGARDVFLDTDVDGQQGIRERILALIEQAEREGSAIGIGHARPGTARALGAAKDEFARRGVRLVSAGDLVVASE